MVTPNPRYRKPLRGLKAAAQVAMSLEGSLALDSEDKIVQHFAGDKQLATMWKSFVLHNKWVTINSQGRYVITAKGREWIRRRMLQPLVVGLHSSAAIFLPIHLESLALPLF